MANEKGSGENLRNMVMQEVTRQLGPLEAKIDRASNGIERLFNSNGGPPGYLQTARKQDNERFDMIFKIFDEIKADLMPLKNFMRDHMAAEKQKEKDDLAKEVALAAKVQDSERRFKRWLAMATLFLGLLTFVMNLHGCGNQLKAMISVADNQTQSTQIPPLRAR